MARRDACIASSYTSAGAFIVTTASALLYGVAATGSASATGITVFKNATTAAGNQVFFCSVPATAATNQTLVTPIVCPNGICTTNAGTLVGYTVLYANL